MSALSVESEPRWRAGRARGRVAGGLSDADVTGLLDPTTIASSRPTVVVALTAAEADRRRLGEDVGARHTHDWWRTAANKVGYVMLT